MTPRILAVSVGAIILLHTISVVSPVIAEPPKGTPEWYQWDMERTKKLHEQNYEKGEYSKKNCKEAHPTWSDTICTAVTNKKILIGMTKEQVYESWGYPKKTHRVVSATGVKEQWAFPGTFLYFENGILTSWEE